MTTYEKELADQLAQRYPELPLPQMIAKLTEIGVIDYSRCKTLSVREHVNALVRSGDGCQVEGLRKIRLLLRIHPQVHVLLQGYQPLLITPSIQP